MPNTFLNTGRTTGYATSNVQENLNQANNQNEQPIQNNVNGTAGVQQFQQIQQNNQSNQINPIAIPIQIQPQIAPVRETQNINNSQQDPNLEVVKNEPAPNYNAPTPQTYQGNSQSNNIVDFNQIYNSYNQAVGNNNQNIQGESGVKKTSYNTTIVTPTTNNLNSVEGQYQSAYADTINGLISEMLSQTQNGFNYDPTQDAALKMATEYAANSTLQSLAGSGVLNSSATAERVSRIVSELIPQYEEKAHNRWIEYLGQLADTAQLVMNYDSQQFEYWKDAKNREFENKKFEYQKQQDAIDDAWKRVDELGYVDNYASTVLGVKVGTLSGAAREAKEQREFELQRMREQAELEYANNVALAKLKSQLETEQSMKLAEYQNRLDIQKSKELASYQSSLNRSDTEYEYQLQQKYGTSKSSKSNSNYSTYDEIIKNRFAEYDDFTKQYVVPDEQTYNELADYLDTLNASGLISDEEFLQLSAKYSKYNQSSYSNNSSNSNQKKFDEVFGNVMEQAKKGLSIFK